MPFTLFHMGPGILIKAILHSSFSLMVFGWSQIVMDIQPLFVLLTGDGNLHGFSHTYVGATLLAVFSALTGKYLSEAGLVVLKIADQQHPIRIAWWVAFSSAFIGTYSHVVLDSIMHSDMRPYWPFNDSNGFLYIISSVTLHKALLISGAVGTVLYFGIHALITRHHASAKAHNE